MSKKKTVKFGNEDLEYVCICGNFDEAREILKRDKIKLKAKYVELAIINSNYDLVCKFIDKNLISIKKIENIIDDRMIEYIIKNDYYELVIKLFSSKIIENQFSSVDFIKLMIKQENNIMTIAMHRKIINKKNIKKYAKESRKKALINTITFGTQEHFDMILDNAIWNNDDSELDDLDFVTHLDVGNLCTWIIYPEKEKVFDYVCKNVLEKYKINDIYEHLDSRNYETMIPILIDIEKQLDSENYCDSINDYNNALEYCVHTELVIHIMKDIFTRKEIIEFIKENDEYTREDFDLDNSCDYEDSCQTCPSCEDCGRHHGEKNESEY